MRLSACPNVKLSPPRPTEYSGENEAPEYTWTHTGAGSNLIYVDPANDLVIVARWIQGGQFDDVVHLVLDAMGRTTDTNGR